MYTRKKRSKREVKVIMKKMIEVTEEGFLSFMGENVMIFAANYIYAGKLMGVNDTCILLENAKIVYETGSFDKKGYSTSEDLPGGKAYIQTVAIEMFCKGK